MEDKCTCINIPQGANFIIGKEYDYGPIIDGKCVYDEKGVCFTFDEIHFLWYFKIQK